jgi:hypothetical protein
MAGKTHHWLAELNDRQCHVEFSVLSGKRMVSAVQLMKQTSRRI